MKVSYYSLGCKVNEYESISIINEFIDKGFELVKFSEEADVYIINTCTVTHVSDSKSRKIIRQATRHSNDKVVAVMGCFSQLNPEVVQGIPGVDVILGTGNRHLLFDLVNDALINKNKHYQIKEINKEKVYEEIKVNRFENHTRGFIKIQDGCDNFCSYCAIPYARGRVRSRKAEDVIKEVQDLTNKGMKEIVLTGINTGAYGKDFNDYKLADLLAEIVNSTPNLGRVRISSIEVTEISDKLLKVVKENERHFCMHFHIPLQGGTNEILKMMNRKYDLNYYKGKVEQIKNMFAGVNITTDYLVGFPGETDELFQKGKEFIDSMDFGEMHIFPYSKRPHTLAINFDNHIDEITKKYRMNELLNLNREKALKYRNKFVGEVLEIIVEKNSNNIAYGHSSNYLEVEFSSSKENNEFSKVMINEVNYPISIGKEIKDV
jgi:threonylcarbamoyladenosine tRNA methylthiotransferase MtaB